MILAFGLALYVSLALLCFLGAQYYQLARRELRLAQLLAAHVRAIAHLLKEQSDLLRDLESDRRR